MSSSFMNTGFLQRIFEKLDKNHDGLVTLDELQWLLERLGFVEHTAEELELIVGKQSLDLDEFLRFYDTVLRDKKNKKAKKDADGEGEDDDNDNDEDILSAFKVFDVNGDGYISSQELRIVLERLGLWDKSKGEEDCGIMIRVHDKNLDGVIDFEEFKNMILHV